jgi:anti-anti-sigma factor
MDNASLRLGNRLAELTRLQSALAELANGCGASGDALDGFHLALEEAASNVIRHAWADGGPHEFSVNLRADSGWLVVEIEDDGQPFNPLACRPPDLTLALEDRPRGGLGVWMIRRLTDVFDCRRTPDGRNRTVLRRRLGHDPNPERPMNATLTKAGTVLVVALTGRLDATAADDLERQLSADVDAGERRLLFDLSALDYVSSGGLRVFVALARRLKDDGSVSFCGVTGSVKQVFDMTGLSLRMPIAPTREEALARLGD